MEVRTSERWRYIVTFSGKYRNGLDEKSGRAAAIKNRPPGHWENKAPDCVMAFDPPRQGLDAQGQAREKAPREVY